MNNNINKLTIFFAFFFITISINAQESLQPLRGNFYYLYSDLSKTEFYNKNKIAIQTASFVSIQIPFSDDFFYASTQSYPNQNLWQDSTTYVNTGYATAPPSIGVATFDGLNKHGFPYTPNLLNLNLSFPADTLTSKPINLFTKGTQTLQPSDSIALTFYYQAKGFGDSPETTDTLIVDFKKPAQGTNKWQSNIWYVRGNSNGNINDTVFKRGFIWISDTAYLHDGFQFRFRNKATTAGDYDHWHVDYVYLDKGRGMLKDTTYDDISFGYVPTPFLQQYSAMPWEQFLPSETASKNSVFIRNNGDDPNLNMTYESKMYVLDNIASTYSNTGYSYPGGANPTLGLFRKTGWSNYAAHANPSVTYTFGPFTDSTDFKFEHRIYRSGSSSDFFPRNDTVFQFQKFRNYYAYDDGSAEAAYFVSGIGVKIAQKFTVNITDTLRAVRIYFDPIGSISTATDVLGGYAFRVSVWNSTVNPLPLYQDSIRKPKYYTTGFKGVPEYTLTSPLVLAPGTYYIGVQQKVATGIGIGFDKNLNHMNNLYFDSGNGWAQSTIPGSLMIHPVFGKKIPPPVGIKEFEVSGKISSFFIYPNPANNQLIISATDNEKASYQLINLFGQIVDESKLEEFQHTLSTENIENGVYFLILSSNNQLLRTQKIIIQH